MCVCVWCRLYLLEYSPWISLLLLLYCSTSSLFFSPSFSLFLLYSTPSSGRARGSCLISISSVVVEVISSFFHDIIIVRTRGSQRLKTEDIQLSCQQGTASEVIATLSGAHVWPEGNLLTFSGWRIVKRVNPSLVNLQHQLQAQDKLEGGEFWFQHIKDALTMRHWAPWWKSLDILST